MNDLVCRLRRDITITITGLRPVTLPSLNAQPATPVHCVVRARTTGPSKKPRVRSAPVPLQSAIDRLPLHSTVHQTAPPTDTLSPRIREWPSVIRQQRCQPTSVGSRYMADCRSIAHPRWEWLGEPRYPSLAEGSLMLDGYERAANPTPSAERAAPMSCGDWPRPKPALVRFGLGRASSRWLACRSAEEIMGEAPAA